MCYTDKEMMLAARSLATKPVFTNHSPTMADGKMRSEGMVIHADWFPEKQEVVGVAALKGPNAKHLWNEIKMHGRAPVSQRTHYFKSFKVGGFEYPEGIVFDEVSLIVDDENPGKPGDYVEALEAAQASMQYAYETLQGVSKQYVSTDKVRNMKKEGVEQTTPPLAKLQPKVSFNKGRFAGPASPKQTIRSSEEFATRYGQGYREPPAHQTIDLPGEYGPPLNYARIRGGPGADIPFPAARVQMPGTGGQSAAEPTAKPHMDEDAGDGLPQGSRGTTKRGNVGRPQGDQGYIKPVPTAAYTKPGATGGDEKINFDVPQKSPSLLGTPASTPDRHLQAMPPRRSMSAGGVGTAGLLAPLEQDADGEDGDGDGEDDGDADAKKMRGQDADGEDDGDAEDADNGEDDGEQSEAVWTTKYINALPAKAFAKPKEREYPHHRRDGAIDSAHVMACASYAAKLGDAAAKAHCDKHKQEMGIGEFAKTAQERLQWERYTKSIEPLFVIERALVELAQEDDSLNARIGGFIEEALNKEFNRSKMGEFMRMFGPRLVQMEMKIDSLEQCAAEMQPGTKTATESAPATENIISGVIEGLTIRARQIADQPIRSEQLQGLMGRNVAVAYAKQVRTKALRDLGFSV